MSPTTQRICLTLEATKDICFTILTVEGVKQLLVRFHREVLVQHPYISAAALLLWSFYPQFPFHTIFFVLWVLPCGIILGILAFLGFETDDVRSDSVASRYQSRYYYIPPNGYFPVSQSYGTINHNISTARPQRESHPFIRVFWRFVGWLILYASLVVLLKYGEK